MYSLRLATLALAVVNWGSCFPVRSNFALASTSKLWGTVQIQPTGTFKWRSLHSRVTRFIPKQFEKSSQLRIPAKSCFDTRISVSQFFSDFHAHRCLKVAMG